MAERHSRKKLDLDRPAVRQADGPGTGGEYRFQDRFKGRRYYLGCYENFEDAVTARRQAEEMYHDGFVREFDEAKAAL